jgi:hypothetical protein
LLRASVPRGSQAEGEIVARSGARAGAAADADADGKDQQDAGRRG